MKKETENKLAYSLSADSMEVMPYVPYMLQDLWSLGSNPEDIVRLIEKYVPLSKDTRVLDIACGKGAVSVSIAKSLGISVCGIDILPEFIDIANKKAKEMGVGELCLFTCADANEAVLSERGYDCTILGGPGNILGTWPETLKKMRDTLKPNGLILMDESYLPDDATGVSLKYELDQMTRSEWQKMFEDSGLAFLEEVHNDTYDYERESKMIAVRAEEVAKKHPEKRALFEKYVQNQLDQSDDLTDRVVAVTWALKNTL